MPAGPRQPPTPCVCARPSRPSVSTLTATPLPVQGHGAAIEVLLGAGADFRLQTTKDARLGAGERVIRAGRTALQLAAAHPAAKAFDILRRAEVRRWPCPD